MKKVIILCAALALASCSTTKTGTSKTLDIYGAGVLHLPVISDLDVASNKASHTMTLRKVENMKAARNLAVSELLKIENADVLVEPSFETETSGSKTILTVKGWPAKYKNFRTITQDDIKLLNVNRNYQVNETIDGDDKKKTDLLGI
jgi:hypothetical protein